MALLFTGGRHLALAKMAQAPWQAAHSRECDASHGGVEGHRNADGAAFTTAQRKLRRRGASGGGAAGVYVYVGQRHICVYVCMYGGPAGSIFFELALDTFSAGR